MTNLRPALLSRLALALAVSLVLACATMTGAEGEPDYSSDAETNLKKGNEDFENRNYLEAQKYFEYVRAKYPYLEAAKEAELRVADTLFEREQYLEARDAYESFVKLHPTYPKVDYAAYRAALTHYKQIPSDFFILPPSEEKDQTEIVAALKAMTDFLRTYPKSDYSAKAQEVVQDTRKRLARHELYVAGFYQKREKWRGVVNRLETVARDYQGIGFDEEALFGLYDAYTHLHEPEKAKAALQEVITRMPGTPAAEKAKKLLAKS